MLFKVHGTYLTMFNTPILFIVFNRPNATQQVFEKIAAIKPRYLFVAADGPRKDVIGELEVCNRVRQIIANSVTWECEVKLRYNDDNKGCKVGVSSAIDWFFEQVDEGIILEDDCVPNISFFNFCSQLLKFYKNNSTVMMIGGTSFQQQQLTNASYYFSQYVHIWGWATWKDRWQKYDVNLAHVDESKVNRFLKTIFHTKRERTKWLNDFLQIKTGQVDTWDTQWMFTIWGNEGLCVVPWKNLITNIGYGPDATHTTMAESSEANLPSFTLDYIIHPKKIALNTAADSKIRYEKFITPNKERIRRKIASILNIIRK
ncbi:MAG: protein containing nucleotide-diphospho-sugar transferase domain [Mucilaginibacter sp.]|nr:protein containing nucleotide-diphospho-sugar transferase domain [Mucilaginibacter sp.]